MTSTRSAAAVATTAAFAAECLLTQAATARSWQRATSPQEALEAFRRCGPATGAVSFPTEVLSSGLVASLAVTSARRGGRNAPRWALASVSMAGTLALLPLHFARANWKLMDRDFPASEARAELASWSRWNRARTGLALLATVLAVSAASDTVTA